MKLEEFFSYDESSEVLTIHGLRYTRGLFEHLALGVTGSLLRIMARHDGVLTLQKVEEPSAVCFDKPLTAEQLEEFKRLWKQQHR